jgi:hypothetical protein
MKSYLIAVFAILLLLLDVRPAVALDADSALVRSLARHVSRSLPAELVANPLLPSRTVAPLAATLPAASAISPSSTLERFEPASEVAPTSRSLAFPVLATTYVALNAIDIYTTTKAIGSGRGVEANPVMGSVAGTPVALTAAKIATTATTLVLARRLWKQHKTASIVLLVTANAGMGFVVSHNTRVAGGF